MSCSLSLITVISTSAGKPQNPSKMPRPDLFTLYREHLAAMRASLARASAMLQAGKVRFITVKPTVVKTHKRAGYRRAYYPPLRRA